MTIGATECDRSGLGQPLQEGDFLAHGLRPRVLGELAQGFVFDAQVAAVVGLAQDRDEALEVNVALVDGSVVFAVFPAYLAPDVPLIGGVADVLAMCGRPSGLLGGQPTEHKGRDPFPLPTPWALSETGKG